MAEKGYERIGQTVRLDPKQFNELRDVLKKDIAKWLGAIATDLNTGFALVAAAIKADDDAGLLALAKKLEASRARLDAAVKKSEE